MRNRPTKYKPHACAECGIIHHPTRRDEITCSVVCRKAIDNRAMTRGRDLYHLFMALRYERGLAAKLGVWAAMCRMAMHWRDEDKAERGGRKSWRNPRTVIERLMKDYVLI